MNIKVAAFTVSKKSSNSFGLVCCCSWQPSIYIRSDYTMFVCELMLHNYCFNDYYCNISSNICIKGNLVDIDAWAQYLKYTLSWPINFTFAYQLIALILG